jgi:hypothetical protein
MPATSQTAAHGKTIIHENFVDRHNAKTRPVPLGGLVEKTRVAQYKTKPTVSLPLNYETNPARSGRTTSARFTNEANFPS